MGTIKMENKDIISVLSDKNDSGSAKRRYEKQKHEYIIALQNAASQMKLDKELKLKYETENGCIYAILYNTNNLFPSGSGYDVEHYHIFVQEKEYGNADEVVMYKEFEDILKSETEKLKKMCIIKNK